MRQKRRTLCIDLWWSAQCLSARIVLPTSRRQALARLLFALNLYPDIMRSFVVAPRRAAAGTSEHLCDIESGGIYALTIAFTREGE